MIRQGVEEHHEGKLWLYEQEQQREFAAALWHRAIIEEGSNAEWISFQKVHFGCEHWRQNINLDEDVEIGQRED